MTPQRTPTRSNRASFEESVETAKASSQALSDVLRDNNVYLGGSSMGKGLNYAARYFLQRQEEENEHEELLQPDDPFYIVDIGVVISQMYQWRKYFPRVEPFYAVKCNPDPVLIKTLAIMGANFDCASRNEIVFVQNICRELGRNADIIYANPCKGPHHLREAVKRGVTLVTFDNVAEVFKCAAISKEIQLVLRIVTDDRGSQCRLSSKYGAPCHQWRLLLRTAQQHGVDVVGVSFHVGSGCRDATRYEAALQDARDLFNLAEKEFGIHMTLLDIGGGLPGETHSMWNPAAHVEDYPSEHTNSSAEHEDKDSEEGLNKSHQSNYEDKFMFFTEIAEIVAPVIDCLFPPNVRVIGEPGRYVVAAAATLVASIIGERNNAVYNSFSPSPVSDKEAKLYIDHMTREEEQTTVRKRVLSKGGDGGISDQNQQVVHNIVEELADYSRLYAQQNLAQQVADVYNDALDLCKGDFETASDLFGEERKKLTKHTAEGINKPLATNDDELAGDGILTLAAAGEAAVSGVVQQTVVDAAPLQDDYAYYINDGVYGGFNNLVYDHASVRPRRLHHGDGSTIVETCSEGLLRLNAAEKNFCNNSGNDKAAAPLYASTVFGPTCDSMDVIARSVLLPKMQIGDWMYFQNMGAYTMAAASSFNGFTPTRKYYVCSIDPEFFEKLIFGPPFPSK